MIFELICLSTNIFNPLLKGREKYSDYTKDYVKKLYETPLTFAKLSEYNKIRKAIGEKELTLKGQKKKIERALER